MQRHRVMIGSVLVTVIVLLGTIGVWHRTDSLTKYEFLVNARVPGAVISQIFADEAKIQYLLGNRHLGGDGVYDLVKAERYYDRAVALDPSVPFLRYQRARVYFLTMRYRTAITEVNLEIERDPNFSRSYYLRGLIYGYDRQLENAAADFAEFVRRQPDEWAGYNDLAWIQFQMGDFAGVKQTMEQVLKAHRNAWLLNSYGVALLNLGELESAKAAFIEANELAADMSPEVWGLGYIGNNPGIYSLGLDDMRRNIKDNLELVEKRLSEGV